MRLSAPIYVLKRQAKQLSRSSSIPLHAALTRVALQEGFDSWSLLASRYAQRMTANRILETFEFGDLVLLGARQGHGKTALGVEMAARAVSKGHQAFFFTLEYTEDDVKSLRDEYVDANASDLSDFFIDTSDAISAEYVISKMGAAKSGSVAVIDYMQLLDQDRRKPPLADQIEALKRFIKRQGVIVILITQVDRAFESTSKELPDMEDIRLPNPANLGLFSKAVFLNNGEIQLRIFN